MLSHKMEAQAKPLLCLDFELSDKQFQSRYCNNCPFSLHLYLLQVDRDKIDIPDDIETSLSILILAHTPKIAESTPITQNDMAGSKHLMNVVVSAFALGQSNKNGRLRYLTQIKVRACEAIFTTQNVVTLQIEKQNNFTGILIHAPHVNKNALSTTLKSPLTAIPPTTLGDATGKTPAPTTSPQTNYSAAKESQQKRPMPPNHPNKNQNHNSRHHTSAPALNAPSD